MQGEMPEVTLRMVTRRLVRQSPGEVSAFVSGHHDECNGDVTPAVGARCLLSTGHTGVVPFDRTLKPRKGNPVKGKPQGIATIPARTECHFTSPNRKSTTTQIEKKATGLGRFISPALCSTLLTIPIERG